MTQEQKELLIKDLCARLDTNLVCSIYRTDDEGVGYRDEILHGYCKGDIWYEFYFSEDCSIGIDNVSKIKPYLFPLSSMTDEQEKELITITDGKFRYMWGDITNAIPRKNPSEWGISENAFINGIKVINILYIWLLKNHFDINGLIPMGLAEDATGLNIY